MPPLIDLIGRQFGRLTVLRLHDHSRSGQRRYLCRCDCGTETIVWGRSLRDGHTASCGCLQRERVSAARTTHGHSRGPAGSPRITPTYASWQSMLSRVKSMSPRSRPYYLDRGVTVCERWQAFDLFLADMGERPPGTSIDRKNPDGNYEPGNCRWATPKEQRASRRRHHAARARSC